MKTANSFHLPAVFDARRLVARITLLTFLFQNLVLAAGPQVPVAGSGTTTYTAPNGVPVVNIAAPNASGLSHNYYDTFNVPKNGTVLNNATDVRQSILAGTIRENPNLNGKSASIILNDITSTQRSVLEGYLEVNGPEAEVIVANPNGITCSGCGFINTPRASLTTGSPNLDANGNLSGFTVHQGDILINGKGLDASVPNYFDLVARTVNIQGQINAKDLQVTAGANQFDYASRSVTGQASASGDQPLYAIDSSALGGMYADRVRLLATENGVGVRLLGDAAATASDLTINAAGKIELRNKTYAANDINISGDGIASGGDPKNYLYAEHNAKLDAGNNQLTQTDGLVYAGNKLDLQAKTIAMNSKDATVYAGSELNAKASQDINVGSGALYSDGNLTLNAPSISVGGASSTLYAKNDLNLDADNDLNLGNGQIVADRNLLLHGGSVSDSSNDKDLRHAGNNLSLTTAGDIVLDNGQVYDAGRDMSLTGKNIQIGGKTATTLTGGYEPGSGIYLNASQTIDIDSNGSIQSSGDVALNAPQSIRLAEGAQVLALNNFLAQQYRDFDIFGSLIAGGDIYLRPDSASTISTTHIHSTGAIQGYGLFSLQGSGADQKHNVRLNIDAGDQSKQQGQLIADSFDINADTIEIGSQDATHYGLLQGGLHGGTINVNKLQLNGLYSKLIANTNIGDEATTTLNINGDLSNPGLIFAFGNLNINAFGNIDNLTDAAISSGFGNLNINMLGAGKRFDNRANATLYAFENLAVLYPNGGTFFNHATGANSGEYGIVQSFGSTRLGSTCDPTGNGSGPTCKTGSTPAMTVTNQGRIESDGDISIVAQTFRNNVPYTSTWIGPIRSGGEITWGDSGTFGGTHDGTSWPYPSGGNIGPETYHVVFSRDGLMYLDFQRIFKEIQQNTLAPYRPRISAGSQGGTLSISTWDGDNTGGTLEGFNVFINSFEPDDPTSRFVSGVITHDEKKYFQQIGRYKWLCRYNDGPGIDTECNGVKDFTHPEFLGEEFPNGSALTFDSQFVLGVDLGSTISAVNFRSSIGNLTNSGSPQKPVIDPVRSSVGGKLELGTPKDPTVPTLPSGPNGQFVLNSSPNAKFLVESNPLYASADNPFLGSDYLAELLGLDSDKLLLRLGDANYENRLIKDQIQQQAGLSLLRSAGSEYDQQKMLMDNASLEAKEQKLSFGVALTSDQVAALKHDMVWMVEKDVQGHKVLVPVVYLTDATRAQTAGDATILAQNAVITGETFTNRGGSVSGSDKLVVVTRKDIVNSSGTLMGGNVALQSKEGDIINRTEVFRMGGGDNYADVAGKTGGIYATGDLYMDAAHDVKIEGANTYADGNTTIRAGNNVDIKSLVLESSSHSSSIQHVKGGQTKTETSNLDQRAQMASVGSGGNITVVGKNDVNVVGAAVASENGDTTLLAKEGNVNISTLELKHNESTKADKQGFFTEQEVDAENTSAGVFSGYEKSTSSTDTRYTQNAGSYIGGKGVNIVAQKGDVNVKGSNVEAGENGAYIDAANDVNITAAYDTYSSTSSYEGHKVGTSADANADGAFSGLRYQRDAGDSSQNDRYAVTSGIKSGGDIIVKAGNKLSNEGTDYDAANDIYVAAKEVENKAAYSTSDYTGHSESDRYGVYGGGTTNGMGQSIANQATGKGGPIVVASPEAQAKIGGESSRTDQSESSSTAKVTQFKAGGNVVFDVEGKMVDEGTQYDAGKTIQIVADSYENKAAANTKTSRYDNTSAGGQVTLGINAASEVTATAGGYGGHSQESAASSEAVVGGFKAGNNVVIHTKGDTTLEGTRIKAGENVGIDAGGNLNFKQANNTQSSTSSSEQASANLSASVCVDLACVSGGGGADGRTANAKENISQGVAGSIEAGGNIGLRSGKDMTLQGTNLSSGKDTLLDAGNHFDYQALVSTHSRDGQADGGGGQLGLGAGTSGKVVENGSVNVSGSFERGRDHLDATTREGGTVQAGGNFVLKSGGDAHLEGTQVAATNAAIDVKGNFNMESAQSTVEQDSYSTKGTVGVGGSRGGGAMGAAGAGHSGGSGMGGGNSLGGSADVDVDIHKKDNLTNQNANIKTTGGTTLNVGGDATLAGARIDADGGVSGEVKGDLNIESRTDRVKEEDTSVKTFVGVNSVTSGGSSTKGMSGAEKADHYQGKGLEAAGNIGGSGVDVAVDAHSKDSVSIGEKSGISGGKGGLGGLTVGGDLTMKGASEEILGADIKGNVSKSDIETYSHQSDVSFRVPGSLAGLTGQDPGKAAEVNGTLFKASGSGNHHSGDHEADLPNRPRSNADAQDRLNPLRPNLDADRGGQPLRPQVDDHQPTLVRHAPDMPEIGRPRSQSDSALPANRGGETLPKPPGASSGNFRMDDSNQPAHRPDAPTTQDGLRPRSQSEPAPLARRDDPAVALPDNQPRRPAEDGQDHPGENQGLPYRIDGGDESAPAMPPAAVDHRHDAVDASSAPEQLAPEQPKQQVFTSDKGFKMKTLSSDYHGENVGNGKFWREVRGRDDINVQYLSPQERDAREVVIQDGVMVYKQSGQRLDTTHDKDGAIFVMDGEGRIYASTEAVGGKFHHSSFLGGEPTAMAGHMIVKDGKLLHLDNESGHYKPDLEQLGQMREYLGEQGVDMSAVPKVGLSGGNDFSFGKWVDSETGQDLGVNKLRDIFSDQLSKQAVQGAASDHRQDAIGHQPAENAPQALEHPQAAQPAMEHRNDDVDIGYLNHAVENAPHAPAHPQAVQPATEHRDDDIDVGYLNHLVENAPVNQLGGYAHLPDAPGQSESGSAQRPHWESVVNDPEPAPAPAKQHVFTSEKGFKMKTLDSDFQGETEGKGNFWSNQQNVKVKYLSPEERGSREVVIKDGLLVYKQSGQKLDTSHKNQGAIFVMDGEGRIYASTEDARGKFHHSSFLGGEPTAMAGHIMARDGKLVYVDNFSGHYKPGLDQLQDMRRYLNEQGVDLSAVPNVGLIGKTDNGIFTGQWVAGDSGQEIKGDPLADAFSKLKHQQGSALQPQSQLENPAPLQLQSADFPASSDGNKARPDHRVLLPEGGEAVLRQTDVDQADAANDGHWRYDAKGYHVPTEEAESSQGGQVEQHDVESANDAAWGYDEHGYPVPRSENRQSATLDRRGSSRNLRHKAKKLANGTGN